jgi:hypothetical protein
VDHFCMMKTVIWTTKMMTLFKCTRKPSRGATTQVVEISDQKPVPMKLVAVWVTRWISRQPTSDHLAKRILFYSLRTLLSTRKAIALKEKIQFLARKKLKSKKIN